MTSEHRAPDDDVARERESVPRHARDDGLRADGGDTSTSVKEQFEEIASFEGPDTYWSIQIIRNEEDDTFTVWVWDSDGPKEPLCTGVGRFFSYEKSWEDWYEDTDTDREAADE